MTTLEYCGLCKTPINNWAKHNKTLEHQQNVRNIRSQPESIVSLKPIVTTRLNPADI